MKFLSGVLCGALVIAPVERVEVVTQTQYQVIVREVPVLAYVYDDPEPTPILDSYVDWEEFDRQAECLWQMLKEAGVEISLKSVIAFGDYADLMGGACLLIGEDDE